MSDLAKLLLLAPQDVESVKIGSNLAKLLLLALEHLLHGAVALRAGLEEVFLAFGAAGVDQRGGGGLVADVNGRDDLRDTTKKTCCIN